MKKEFKGGEYGQFTTGSLTGGYEISEQFEPEHTYTITARCHMTNELNSVVMKAKELFAYNQGGGISAFTSLSSDDREFLLSGTSPKGWKILFGSDE